jgi:non-canonical poly(A) RNA polymerase PAPD5/7
MGDSYRPSRRDRDAPPPKSLADRMTFSGGGGDSYRPSGSQSQLEFTFQSNHPAPEFPSSNSGSRAPARSNRGGGNRGGRRDQRPRNNANGNRRGGPRRKEAPHERALLQHQDVGSPEHTYGVSDGPNRFMNVDDMSDHEEADMVESDASTDGDAPNGKHKVAKTGASRADGDAVPEFARPQWSNPDPYTACPPPSETTGVKKDVVQLIRKAKNEAAIKAIGNNAVAANDDFISFDNDEADGTDDAQLSEDDEPNYGRAHGRASQRPVQDSMGDLARNPDMRDEPYRDTYDSYQPQRAGKSKKRKAEEVEIVQDWLPIPRTASTPWATKPLYKHLAKEPEKW